MCPSSFRIEQKLKNKLKNTTKNKSPYCLYWPLLELSLLVRSEALWWAARTLYKRHHLKESLECADPSTERPRWQTFTVAARGTAHSFCQASVTVQQSFLHMDNGLGHLIHFWQGYRKSFQKYCLGDVGLSEDMSSLLRCMLLGHCHHFVLLPMLTAVTPKNAHENQINVKSYIIYTI